MLKPRWLKLQFAPLTRSHGPETGHFRVRYGALLVEPHSGEELMCDFDQRSGRGVFRMGFTLVAASLAEWLHTVFLELTMQNTKDTQSRNQPPQDNQSKDELQYHEGSAQVVGKSLNVNENDVRDQNRPGSEAVKDGQKCHEDSADVVGNSLHVNENDVRDQNRSDTEAVKGGERSDTDNKN